MDVETISMPKEAALEKLHAYKSKLQRMKISKANAEAAEEYKAAIKGYEALAKGTKLIDIQDVFENCPRGEDHRPKLAIIRADVKQVYFKWRNNSTVYEFSDADNRYRRSTSTRIVQSKANQFIEVGTENWNRYKDIEGYALTPMIPLDVRPVRLDLKNHFILWEVEKWADVQIKAKPDVDPYLLKHLAGTLYAVIAEWELTELERSILKGRL